MPMANLNPADSPRPMVERSGWIWISILTLLFVTLHASYLERLFRIVTKSNGSNLLELLISAASSTWNADWSHALVVPLISLYFVHQHRPRLGAAESRVSWWGLPVLFLGLIGYAFWIYPGRNDMFQGYSMILGLLGVVLFVLGPSMMKVLWFPIVYLVFAIKISDKIWEQIAWKLQHIAATWAAMGLKILSEFMNFDVENHGSTIDLTYVLDGRLVTEPMNVAEACSGLRMLMAFVALGVAMAFLWERPWWHRLFMILMAVPIAIAVNVGRVTVIGVLFLFNKDMATGDFHTFVGMLMLIPAAMFFMLLGWILDHIIIYDEAEAVPDPSPRSSSNLHPEAPSTANKPIDIAKGISFGIGLVLLAGVIYTQVLYLGRPDLVSVSLPQGIAVGLLLVVGLVLIGLIVWLPKVMPASGGARRTFALGLVAGVLLTSAVGQKAVIDRTKAVLIKDPVPLRYPLLTMPTRIGPWQLIRSDPPMSKDQLDALGTEDYISWWYLDTRLARPGSVDVQRGSYPSGSVVRLHIAYYTGTSDTVPHVPDRCILASGASQVGTGNTGLHLAGSGYRPDPDHAGMVVHPVQPRVGGQHQLLARIPEMDIDARYFAYQFGTDKEAIQEVVFYFFSANGKFLSSAEKVRFQGFNLHDKFAYYCKIETQVKRVADKDLAAERISDFLSSLMPEIMACLPDWVDVTEGRWPADKVFVEFKNH